LIVADLTNEPIDTLQLQQDLTFGQLNWKISAPSSTCTFLDVTITKAFNNDSPYISTTLATKPLNLHAFIPPLSCHPKSTLKSLIFGFLFCICHLMDNPIIQRKQISDYFDRFLAQGYHGNQLKLLFKSAFHRFQKQPYFSAEKGCNHARSLHPQLLHLPFNPGDPKSKHIQAIFASVFPQNAPLQAQDTTPILLLQLTICYHQQRALGSLINLSDISKMKGITPKEYLDTKISPPNHLRRVAVYGCTPVFGRE
jgi:hypothetical protein